MELGLTGKAVSAAYEVAVRVVEAQRALPTLRAVLLTGSIAEGTDDPQSDVDLILYHDRLPSAGDRARVLAQLGAELRAVHGAEEDGELLEFADLDGRELQLAHTTLACWERDLDQVLDRHDPATPLQKAVDGLLHGVTLHGAGQVAIWRERAADYPDGLRLAMVEHHLQVFPVWAVAERLATRDAQLFRCAELVAAEQNLLGVLAGLNRVYYSTFQFKRLRRFCALLPLAPPDLPDRLDRLLALDWREAGDALRQLVEQVRDLVVAELPAADTSAIDAALARRPLPGGPA